MQNTASHLELVINEQSQALEKISAAEFSFKPDPSRWSKKEILGHLIDSAQNNIRRFIVAQYEDQPFIVYNQDKWVEVSNYQQWNEKDIIDLWCLLNKQICMILRNTAVSMQDRIVQTQESHSIEWLAEDYVRHLLHHLHVVLDMEPAEYP